MKELLLLVLASCFITLASSMLIGTVYYLLLTLLETGVTWMQCFASVMLVSVFVKHIKALILDKED